MHTSGNNRRASWLLVRGIMFGAPLGIPFAWLTAGILKSVGLLGSYMLLKYGDPISLALLGVGAGSALGLCCGIFEDARPGTFSRSTLSAILQAVSGANSTITQAAARYTPIRDKRIAYAFLSGMVLGPVLIYLLLVLVLESNLISSSHLFLLVRPRSAVLVALVAGCIATFPWTLAQWRILGFGRGPHLRHHSDDRRAPHNYAISRWLLVRGIFAGASLGFCLWVTCVALPFGLLGFQSMQTAVHALYLFLAMGSAAGLLVGIVQDFRVRMRLNIGGALDERFQLGPK